ncbi:hypothetical protein EZS27_023916 [termite gut metagenome]|uniref:Uncharacterized protein n=1 Tax=termite gut metagenome TaxID=433724 RepID=A0A5J4R2Y2_9ZZZZ
MVDTNKFTSVVEDLNILIQKEKEEKFQKKKCLEDKFCTFLTEFSALYSDEQAKTIQQQIVPFIKEYPFFYNGISSLKVINKVSQETYHSLFLAHIWDWSKIKLGETILSDFIGSINIENKNYLQDCIKKKNYTIETEHTIKNARKRSLNGKRIDILIKDIDGKWNIIIENKIYSNISYDKKRKQTQLGCYQQYCKDKFGNSFCAYILLSHTDNSSYCEDGWTYAEYYQIFKSLLIYYQVDDTIKDYLKTLWVLLFPNEQTAIKSDISLYRAYQFYKQIISKIT